jgi:hypothetical protein
MSVTQVIGQYQSILEEEVRDITWETGVIKMRRYHCCFDTSFACMKLPPVVILKVIRDCSGRTG